MGKTARRDKGSGSLCQRADGVWLASLELPPHPLTGKRRRKVATAKTQVEARRKLTAMTRELMATGDLPTTSPTVEQYMTAWLKRVARRNLKPRTAAGYESYARKHIIPALGRKRLDRLAPSDVARMTTAMVDSGLSSTTALQAHRILQKALHDAVREGVVPRNVAALAQAPARAVSNRTALTVPEAIQVLHSLEDQPDKARWYMALLTGCRQGEALGLQAEHVHLEVDVSGRAVGGWLELAWQLQRLPKSTTKLPAGQEGERIGGGTWLVRPKSRAGWRKVALSMALARALQDHMVAHPGRLVFNDNGHPIDAKADWVRWKAVLKAAGVRDVPLHSARHTTSTLLQRLGYDEQTRMSIMGHSSAAMTAAYTHIDLETQGVAMAGLSGLLLPQIEP